MHSSVAPTNNILQGSTELMSQINKLHLCVSQDRNQLLHHIPPISKGGDALELCPR